MLTIHCTLRARPENTADLSARLAIASQTYMRDAGTLSWTVHQSTSDLTAFMIVEMFADEAAKAVHEANPYFKEHNAIVKPWLVGFEVSLWRSLEGGYVPVEPVELKK
ncbi:uncharacterized protein EV422DRAFT_530480 [Fimicolochytrium jonesii]|uniref:uncharacterized protein n=1 Tax=Fimicolochytrium jonesii TaxID=1396493 RepID=UPI0022FF208C|nr:uncharacterized protein EV422DRAFT_530480 [Fimicolochytrium jonesii]KAI8820858.1 hypothetical protein EV422DRAFT_530480 [Fimicolochytrium jonesii]